MTTTTYAVAGMTCSHCVAAVTDELVRLGGVTSVDVDLAAAGPSRVTVKSDHALSDEMVRAAVDEAGYELAATG